MRKTTVAIFTIALLLFGGFSRVYAVNPTPPSREGYSTSVYFEAVGGSVMADGTYLARYTKVQRVSIRFTDLASGVLYFNPTWNVNSNIQSVVTSNIRSYNCTVTYSNGQFVIRPSGAMEVTFECLYLNYSANTLNFDSGKFFEVKANGFDASGITAYELSVSDDLVHTDLGNIYGAVDGIEGDIDTLVSDSIFIKSNTHASATYLQNILAELRSADASSSIADNTTAQTSAKTDSDQIHAVDTSVLNSMDTALSDPSVSMDIVGSINSEPNAKTTFQWVAQQMQTIVGLGADITPLWEFSFVAPLVVGLALVIIGRSVKQ